MGGGIAPFFHCGTALPFILYTIPSPWIPGGKAMAIALFAHIHLLPKVIHGIDLSFIGCQMAMTSSPCLSQLQRDFLGSSDGDVGHFTLAEP